MFDSYFLIELHLMSSHHESTLASQFKVMLSQVILRIIYSKFLKLHNFLRFRSLRLRLLITSKAVVVLFLGSCLITDRLTSKIKVMPSH